MDSAYLVELLLHGVRLKQTPRSGWALRGVPGPESVADHSYGVAFTALILAKIVVDSVDLGKVLALALIHDLPEGVSSDIPAPAWRHMPAGVKEAFEKSIMEGMVGEDPLELRELWNERQEGISVEARIVQDADLIDLFVQAVVYENQSGNRSLAEFFDREVSFNFPQAQAICEEINSLRISF